ncbi:hypothetical protein PHYC_02338 [Phycisphaerales bacterium]|nr:hypothetical protein PHYC_02338 [Phycisphaerales bacterium]
MLRLWLCIALAGALAACSTTGRELRRRGDEIMVAGRLFHTGAPVVLWTDPGGYDAYRTERRFVPWEDAAWAAGKGPESPNRFGIRKGLTPEQLEQVRGGGWDLPTLRSVVDQFVIHYDVCGVSRQCFRVLHDARGLSVHFMLDLDGTIYQTLDVKERAWHAGAANDRSVGIEIANIGAYPPEGPAPDSPSRRREAGGRATDDPPLPQTQPAATLPAMLSRWYSRDELGTRITIPSTLGDGGIRTPNFTPRPARDQPITGPIHGATLTQFDLTPQQYRSLIRLTATLCRALPKISCDYPRDDRGRLITTSLTESQLANYRGLLGHYHVTKGKIDPGPAFDWDRVVTGARAIMR